MIRQVRYIVSSVLLICSSAALAQQGTAAPGNATATTPPNPVAAAPKPLFKFSIPYKQMEEDPRKSLLIVNNEVAKDPEDKRGAELSARRSLGIGFEAIGDFDSAAKNFAQCRQLYKVPAEDGALLSSCLLELVRVGKFSNGGLPIEKLFELRNDKLLGADLKAQFFAELINGFSSMRAFDRAKQVAKEAEAFSASLGAIDKYLLTYSQASMLVDAKEFPAAEGVIKQVRLLAGKKPVLESWVDHLEATYFLGIKDFAKAKANYQRIVGVIGKSDSKFNAFWVHYLGVKVGFYLGDQKLLESASKECARILRGSESEKKFLPLVNAWTKLFQNTDVSAEIASVNKEIRPGTNLIEELNVAMAWKKTK